MPSIAPDNRYTQMQRTQYDREAEIMAETDHAGHNFNPDYKNILLKAVTENPARWHNKVALDFGSGTGRNVFNLLQMADWKIVYGVDISSENVRIARSRVNDSRARFIINNGVDLGDIESGVFDFVMSTIVLQHIAVWQIRRSLLDDIFRTMKVDGIFSFQMAKYFPHWKAKVGYFENNWDAPGTNGGMDVSVDYPSDLVSELEEIGFKQIEYVIRDDWDYIDLKPQRVSCEWIYVQCQKK
jgi:SAM-dependent methyltransferase